MEHYELPLVFFTVFAQWGIGGVLALTLCQNFGTLKFNAEEYRRLALLFWVITVLGSLASLAHLGTPTGAYRAMAGLGISWLSREVVAFIVLNAVIFCWLALCWLKPGHPGANLLGGVTAFVGLVSIFVTSQVYYQMALHSLWHTIATPLGFLATAVLLGFMSVAVAGGYWHKSSSTTCNAGIVIGIVLTAGGLWFRYHVPGADASSPLLWWQLFASICVAVWGISRLNYGQQSWVWVVLMATGELAGRMLFYSNVMSGVPWF
ncbi:TPA: dimethyl sulfoxide reductase anchor subunit family protein [Citrobacter braakii]|uniref:Dimethyl sulfoxide reductase n=2 Tax=Enterobacteriaceae TaxID=543 RepID=A0A1V8P127_CITBR|nr:MULTISPECIES: DmsC/YnfH family molybdoenzyme membrane anchor subunit [Citrobacter]MBS6002303.1 dimethyl sulfoxide reductase anchor subunit [Citrobacter sp.]MDV0578573.1 DmsC/YnfH family molybdoenzyme membrane anchor subunit [Citrobacter braakii]MEB0650277.1 DmsC/YnfH family molybdoenzyme membrane anchor subunit [Citrobacter braakii]MEB0938566.1 DmsC/YnfH family molybdoenzyme membrane anchor subunit [Citrobacter braakii]MEB0943950.1 DmsC/YnfH family molybdoenzyme membrane anchor subunit [Cit